MSGDPAAMPGLPDLDGARAARVARVTALGLDPDAVRTFIAAYEGLDREALIEGGHLLPIAPGKGTAAIARAHRTADGEELLELAKDVLYALLFGDESTGTRFERVQRELLTLTLPRAKAGAFDFIAGFCSGGETTCSTSSRPPRSSAAPGCGATPPASRTTSAPTT